MKSLIGGCLLVASIGICTTTYGQENELRIGGNTQLDMQYYYPDSIIGADTVPEKMLMNGYTNINFIKGNWSAGFRYEAYVNPILGFDPGYEGTGISYRYVTYKQDNIEVTLGNFYEQFGSGMVFRTYEARTLGYDNAMDGFRIRYQVTDGIHLTSIWGKQRQLWALGEGLIRGFDGEVMINELKESWKDKKTQLTLGGSFVSKYQEDKDPLYILPENVGNYGGRFNLNSGNFNLYGEYAEKINDPSRDNGFIYKDGRALLLEATYSQKGLGVYLAGKMVDNMAYRSDRTASGNNVMINYHPALTKQHTYALAATLYPYATQPTGEMAAQLEVAYKIKKKSKLGGKYGTNVTLNLSTVQGLDTTTLVTNSSAENKRLGYEVNYFNVGSQKYFHDYNIEISRKFNKHLKMKYTYLNLLYNMNVVQGLQTKGTVLTHIHVLEATHRLTNGHAIRWEMQHLGVADENKYYPDMGNWAYGLVEYTYAPHWFFTVLDQYNYGNKDEARRVHYFTGVVGYMKGQHRIQAGYGRQRAGIFCVGGVCRNVPAANGFTLSITSNF